MKTLWKYLFGPNRVVTCPWCQKHIRTTIMEGEVGHLMCDARVAVLRKEAAEQRAAEEFQKEQERQAAEDRRQIELYKQAIREMQEEQRSQNAKGISAAVKVMREAAFGKEPETPDQP